MTALKRARSRRPFDPASHGRTKTTYRQADIRDREAVDGLVAEADAVVPLASSEGRRSAPSPQP